MQLGARSAGLDTVLGPRGAPQSGPDRCFQALIGEMEGATKRIRKRGFVPKPPQRNIFCDLRDVPSITESALPWGLLAGVRGLEIRPPLRILQRNHTCSCGSQQHNFLDAPAKSVRPFVRLWRIQLRCGQDAAENPDLQIPASCCFGLPAATVATRTRRRGFVESFCWRHRPSGCSASRCHVYVKKLFLCVLVPIWLACMLQIAPDPKAGTERRKSGMRARGM